MLSGNIRERQGLADDRGIGLDPKRLLQLLDYIRGVLINIETCNSHSPAPTQKLAKKYAISA